MLCKGNEYILHSAFLATFILPLESFTESPISISSSGTVSVGPRKFVVPECHPLEIEADFDQRPSGRRAGSQAERSFPSSSFSSSTSFCLSVLYVQEPSPRCDVDDPSALDA